jgi:hypothetical protein
MGSKNPVAPADYAMWAPAGDALLYAQGNRVMEVPITLGSSITVGAPRVALTAESTRALLDQTFDVTKDGTIRDHPAAAVNR